MSIIPKSNHAFVYSLLVTIPCVGALAGMILYEVLGVNSLIVDTVMVSSAACGVYSSATLILKIARLCILRQWRLAGKCIRITLRAIAINGVILIGYWAKAFFF